MKGQGIARPVRTTLAIHAITTNSAAMLDGLHYRDEKWLKPGLNVLNCDPNYTMLD